MDWITAKDCCTVRHLSSSAAPAPGGIHGLSYKLPQKSAESLVKDVKHML